MATIYIALSGNDTTGDGSEANPYRTFGKAFAAALAGDTIQALDAGPYTERVGHVAKANMTVRGVPGGTVIDATTSPDNAGCSYYTNWVIEDLHVHSAPGFQSGFAPVSIHAATIRRCVAYNNGGRGFESGNADGTVYEHCIAYGNGHRGFDAGTITSNKPVTFAHCLAYDNGHDGIYAPSTRAIAEFCVAALNSVSNVSGAYGIYVGGTARSCISYENQLAYGLRAGTYDHCLAWASSAGSGLTDDEHYHANFYSTPDADSVELDPLFVDADNGDFHLKSSSPAVWTGAASTLGITTDLEGTPLAPVPSMGVYEFVPDGRVVPNPPTFSMTVTLDGQNVGVDPWSEDLSPLDFAVVSSLLTDRRAEPEDVLPVNDGDRRGWWGDGFGAEGPEPFGSRLWLLHRRTANQETATLARLYAEEALAWLVSEGLAESVSVTAEVATGAVIALEVSYRGTRTAEGRVLRLLVDEGAEAAPVHW